MADVSLKPDRLGAGAVTLAVLYYQLFAEEGSLQVAMGHPRIAVEQAIVFKFCGKYESKPKHRRGERFFQPEKWDADETISKAIIATYSTIPRFCDKVSDRFLNGENSR